VEARVLSAGVCWWPHTLLRVQGDVVAESYPDPLVAPEPGRNGPYLTFAGRLQVRLP
jgi:hypothetical protein